MVVYYVEVNALCIIILILFRMQLRNMDTTSSDQRILIAMIWATVAFCVSDMLAGIFRGMLFPGARAIIQISNLVYFEAIAIVSFLWTCYVHLKLTRQYILDRRKMILRALPIVFFTIVALSNPVTHVLFRIDADNLYKRNVGVYLHWIITWTYFLVPSVQAFCIYIKETSKLKRQEMLPLLLFMIAPFVTSIIQMLFYGVTTTQVGITISIVMICLKSQDLQILTDALTGINNRRGMEYFMANQMLHNKEAVYTMVMIDVDHFKQINDKYGHLVGDQVLKQIAESLKQSCKSLSNRMHLSRFGGDEFIILGVDCKESEINLLSRSIVFEIEKGAKEQLLPCEISVSIGITTGECVSESNFKEMVNRADQEMYEEKLRKIG